MYGATQAVMESPIANRPKGTPLQEHLNEVANEMSRLEGLVIELRQKLQLVIANVPRPNGETGEQRRDVCGNSPLCGSLAGIRQHARTLGDNLHDLLVTIEL